MDTPERNQIGTPISKFEDSPVFNYINSLSPIKPVKSTHIAQTFNSLSFASLPSVFTSPRISSLKESRTLRRHQFSDLSKPEFSSDNGSESNTSLRLLDSVQLPDYSPDPPESFDPGTSIKEVTIEHSNLAIELSRNLKYDCGSPDDNPTPCHVMKTDPVLEVAEASELPVQFVQEVSEERCLSRASEVQLEGICQIEKSKEEDTVCDWENLISDAADLLMFNSPNDAEASKGQEHKLFQPETTSFAPLVSKLPQDNIDDLQKLQSAGQVKSCERHETDIPETQLGEVGEQVGTDQTPHTLSSAFPNKQVVIAPNEKMDDKAGICIPFVCKSDSQQQRGMRRRCLVFDMAGAHNKNLEDDSNSSSSMSSQSDGKISSDDKQSVPFKPATGSSPCVLPGIGLHLNALATTSKDCNVVKHETLTSGRQLISMPTSIASSHSLSSGQKPLNKSLALNSMERDMGPADNGVQITQDSSQAFAFGVSEEFNQSSPKKKRRRLEHAGESEACKRCNCKKSKCLKLYCECFAAGVYCVEPCSCQECFNKPVHEDTVLATRKHIESRNPLAFAPKVIRTSDSVPEIGDESNKTPASARHKRGCNCKKSSCLKKYCECYQGGVGCSISCRCEGCKNAFGRKDGSAPIETEEADPEDEETEISEKIDFDKSSHINEVRKDEEHYSDSVLPITPSFQIFRPSVQLPFPSIGKPPRSSVLTVGTSPRQLASQRLKKSDFPHHQTKFEKHFQIIPEDETPEILRGNCSPVSSVKTVSPNRKRVSPPHSEFGQSPGRRNTRKLILQSIPSFPSLTYNETSDFPAKFE